MEYTKDIVLEIGRKRQIGYFKLKEWTSNFKNIIKNNKIITFILSLLIALMLVDFVLVNSFLELLSRVY